MCDYLVWNPESANIDWTVSNNYLLQIKATLCSLTPRTTDTQWSLLSLKSRTFGLGQTNWANKFWVIWGIFSRTISIHFDVVSPLSMFSIIQPLFLQKTKPVFSHPKCSFGIGSWIWVAKSYGFSLRVSVVRVWPW